MQPRWRVEVLTNGFGVVATRCTVYFALCARREKHSHNNVARMQNSSDVVSPMPTSQLELLICSTSRNMDFDPSGNFCLEIDRRWDQSPRRLELHTCTLSRLVDIGANDSGGGESAPHRCHQEPPTRRKSSFPFSVLSPPHVD